MDFNRYVSVQGEVINVLGPLESLRKPNLSKNKMEDQRTSIGKQRDFSLLGNLIRRKFSSNSSNPLIVTGDKSIQTIARFSRPNPRGQIMVSTTSIQVSCPLVGRVSYVFIMSRLSRK